MTAEKQKYNIFVIIKCMQILELNDDILYDAGMDVVPFVDQLNNTFNVFYRGKTYQLETTPPESMKAGCGLVAYVDIDGNFKRFSDGKTKVISTFAPENYFSRYFSPIVYSTLTSRRANFRIGQL